MICEIESRAMRLTTHEIESIKKAFFEVFQDGSIYLFGSRTDDNERGGDIDLYLCPAYRVDNEMKRKIEFIIKLEEYIGEQKIDVVISKDKNRVIEQEALRTCVKLLTRWYIIKKG